MIRSGVIVLACLLTVAGTIEAYESYTTSGTDNCAACHGGFRDSPYVSAHDGQSWGDDLHDAHRNNMLSRECNACHGAATTPVLLGSSTGAPAKGLAPYGCAGCHGRAGDGTGSGTQRFGAGLRQHHWRSGTTTCVSCHADADPASYTPVGENVAPPYYASHDPVQLPAVPSDPCNPAPTYDENYAATTLALDNDGDGVYDGADPNCQTAAQDPGETSGAALSPALVSAHDRVAGTITLSFGVGCATTGNTIEYGDLASVATYAYAGQQCGVGNTGSYTWTYPATPASLFFLIVGNNGTVEGSYGTNGQGVERPEDVAGSACPLPQQLANRCDP